jgi:hypothetical protein
MATVATGREQPVVVDTHREVGEQSRLTHVEFTDHHGSFGITG